MVTASASANKFDAVSGVLEWEDLIILIFKPHKCPTVINMNVCAKDAALGLRILAWVGRGAVTEMGRQRKDPHIGMGGIAHSLYK